MKILPPMLAAFAILLATNTIAFADVLPFPSFGGGGRDRYRPNPPPPPPPVSKAAELVIDATTTTGMRVILPASLVKELQDVLLAAGTPGPIGRLPWSSIMVGAALACGLACVGLGMVRSQRRLTFAALFCLGGATLFTSLGCPNSQTIIPNNPVTDKLHKEREDKANGVLEGTVHLETRGDADKVEITVDKEDLKAFIERTDLPTVQ